MQLRSDWIDLLRALNAAGVRYLIVGAAALSHHGYPRGTVDFDIWVDPEQNNAERVYEALTRFGAPMDQVTVEDFKRDDTRWIIGTEPLRIDVFTWIDGVRFDEAWPQRSLLKLGELEVPVLSKVDLIRNKRAVLEEGGTI